MNKASLTYTFDESDTGYAIYDGKVIASHSDIDELERLASAELAELERKPKKRSSSRVVVNPSGLKGTVLGKPEPGLWGEEVSVRFENGEIRRIAAVFVEHDDSPVEKTASTEPSFVEELNTRLASTYTESPEALVERQSELDNIKREATTLLSGKPSFEEERELHSIVVAADHEQQEIREVLAHYESEQNNEFKPPQPFRLAAVEQGGKADAPSWLDYTVQSMIDEGKATDYEKLMSEGPALFASDLPTGTLADARATQSAAQGFIQSKTAMIQSEVAQEYQKTFLARVEEARRVEYKERTDNLKKEAASKKRDLDNVPDDGLFL